MLGTFRSRKRRRYSVTAQTAHFLNCFSVLGHRPFPDLPPAELAFLSSSLPISVIRDTLLRPLSVWMWSYRGTRSGAHQKKGKEGTVIFDLPAEKIEIPRIFIDPMGFLLVPIHSLPPFSWLEPPVSPTPTALRPHKAPK